MKTTLSRREFIAGTAGCGLAGALLAQGATPQEPPQAPDHTLTVISGTPRERGRQYGRTFKDSIASFLEKELYRAFTSKGPSREEVLRYAQACGKSIREYSPEIHEEMEGMAEGSGLRFEEVSLITIHEELCHNGVLPPITKCTALAAGPPDTRDGHSYVGQNWDWMTSVYGLSQMLLWKRTEGPSVLAYAYPGLWVGAGLNSKGLALCWTSGQGLGIAGPRVGIPSYILIALILYQESLNAAIAEARRATQAGWFTFVLADADGRIVNIESTPRELVVEESRGHLARVYQGTRKLTGTPEGQPVPYHPQCRRMRELLDGAKGKLDRAMLQSFFGDHQSTICKHFGTLDSMLFDCVDRKAYVSRGPGCSGRWKTFEFLDR